MSNLDQFLYFYFFFFLFSHFRGAYRWCDILSMPTNYHREKLLEVEREINIHDVCNIQFTSVSIIYILYSKTGMRGTASIFFQKEPLHLQNSRVEKLLRFIFI